MMISLQKVVDGIGANNLTIVIMEALHNNGSLSFLLDKIINLLIYYYYYYSSNYLIIYYL